MRAREIPIPRIESEDYSAKLALTRAFQHLFMDARRDEGPSHLLCISELYRISIVVGKAEGTTRISHSGNSISFEMEFTGPFRQSDVFSVFSKTNEGQPAALKRVLAGTEGITNYLGIAGGPDGTLARLGMLERSNALSEVVIIDKNMQQACLNAFTMFQYDVAGIGAADEARSIGALGETGSYPRGRHDVTISVMPVDLAVKAATSDGTYLIYLSNAFPLALHPLVSFKSSWSTHTATTFVLGSILANKHIHEGSLVMFADAHSTASFMMRKEYGSFAAHAFVDGSRAYAGDELSAMLRSNGP